MKRALIAIALSLPVFGAVGSFCADKGEKELVTPDPAKVADTLRGGGEEQRSNLARQLDIMAPNPSSPAAKSGAPCSSFDDVEERDVRLRPDADNVVLIANSSACDATYLVVFDRARKGEWRHVQTLLLPAKDSRPDISFAELLRPGVSEILVHRESTNQVGSTQQYNFVVLTLLHDRLQTVLDTVESLQVVLPDKPENDSDNVTQSQQSTFTLEKAPPDSGTAMGILEQEVFKQNKTTLTRYRYWSWDTELQRFRSSPRDGGELVEWKPPAKKAPPQGTPPADKQPQN